MIILLRIVLRVLADLACGAGGFRRPSARRGKGGHSDSAKRDDAHEKRSDGSYYPAAKFHHGYSSAE